MVNDVVLEGIVVWTWKYADDLLFRLACYRDLDLLQKSVNAIQCAADFVTVRVPVGNLGAQVKISTSIFAIGFSSGGNIPCSYSCYTELSLRTK